MTDYELQSLDALNDLVIYIRVGLILVGIIISCFLAYWFTKYVVSMFRTYMRFHP